MFQRALICTDFSDALYRLTQVVPSLVAGGFEHITFFHNVAVQSDRSVPRVDQEAVDAAKQRLEAFLAKAPDGAKVDVEVQVGRPIDNIQQQIERKHADVVFLGMPTRTLLTEKLFGSTTMGLVERTAVPLMILRPQLIATYMSEELALRCRNLFRHLLIPYDGSEGADHFLSILKKHIEAAEHSVLERCLVLWVVDDSIRRELQGRHPIAEAEARLNEVSDVLRQQGVQVETLVKEGDPLEEILLAAETYDISTIAARAGDTGGFMRWSVPSLTREILRQSWHPVLYFPSSHET